MDPIPDIRRLTEHCIEIIQKGKKYLRSGQTAPKGAIVRTGPRGGRYYIVEDKHLKIHGQHHKLIRGVGVRRDQWDEITSHWTAAGAKNIEFINKPNNDKDEKGNPLYNIYVNFGEETQNEIESKHAADRLKFGKKKAKPDPEPVVAKPEESRLDPAEEGWENSQKYTSEGQVFMAMRGKEASGYEIRNFTSDYPGKGKEIHYFEFRKKPVNSSEKPKSSEHELKLSPTSPRELVPKFKEEISQKVRSALSHLPQEEQDRAVGEAHAEFSNLNQFSIGSNFKKPNWKQNVGATPPYAYHADVAVKKILESHGIAQENEKPKPEPASSVPKFSGPGVIVVSGDTFAAKENLKRKGFYFNPNSKKWSRSVWSQKCIDYAYKAASENNLTATYHISPDHGRLVNPPEQIRGEGWQARWFGNHFDGRSAGALLESEGYETANMLENVKYGNTLASTLYYRKKQPTVAFHHDPMKKQAWLTLVDAYDPETGDFGTRLIDPDSESDGNRVFRFPKDGLYQGQESGIPYRRWFEVKDGILNEIEDSGEFREKAKSLPHMTRGEIASRIHQDQEERRQKLLPKDPQLREIANKIGSISALSPGPMLMIYGDTFTHKEWIKTIPGRRWNGDKRVWQVPVPKDGEVASKLFNEIKRRGLSYQGDGITSADSQSVSEPGDEYGKKGMIHTSLGETRIKRMISRDDDGIRFIGTDDKEYDVPVGNMEYNDSGNPVFKPVTDSDDLKTYYRRGKPVQITHTKTRGGMEYIYTPF